MLFLMIQLDKLSFVCCLIFSMILYDQGFLDMSVSEHVAAFAFSHSPPAAVAAAFQL